MGVEVVFRGAHGLVQIDRLVPTLSVVAHGTMADLSGDLVYSSADMPFFALYVPDGYNSVGGIWSSTKSGNTWTVKFAIYSELYTAGILPSQCHWFVLDRPKEYAGAIALRDDDLRPTFSSNYPPKAPVRTFQSGRKYAGIGSLKTTRNLDVDLLTDGRWQFHESEWALGFSCPTGEAPVQGSVLYYDHIGVGTGGGSSGVTTLGIDQPLWAIDVTSYIP